MSDQNKKVAAHYDRWAQTYDLDYFTNFDLYHKVTRENIMRFLPKSKEFPILDAGGGTGIWSIELAQMGYSVVLTDISSKMLEKARKKITEHTLSHLISIKKCDICSMPEFSDNQFSMVLCESDPLSYCSDRVAAVKEFVRVLKLGGVVIASVDNRFSLLKIFKDSTDFVAIKRYLDTGDVETPQADLPYMMHAFTPQELIHLFESCGLVVERIIGKPVIAQYLGCASSPDPIMQDQLYELELTYNSNPAFYPQGGHLEIVGRKK